MSEEKLSSKYITDKNLSKMIQQHVDYVENYLERVETIENEAYKEISYKQLGSIALSAIEALLKSFLVEIDLRCRGKSCLEKCAYRFYNEDREMSKIGIREVISQLNDTRCFWINPKYEEELDLLIEMRNYIHLSKYIEENDEKLKFDKEFVERLLNYYYEVLGQFNLNKWYFLNEEKCLKVLDEDGYQLTKRFNENERDMFYSQKLTLLLEKVYWEKDFDEKDFKLIEKLKRHKIKNIDKVLKDSFNSSLFSWKDISDNADFYHELDRRVDIAWLKEKIKNNKKQKRVDTNNNN